MGSILKFQKIPLKQTITLIKMFQVCEVFKNFKMFTMCLHCIFYPYVSTISFKTHNYQNPYYFNNLHARGSFHGNVNLRGKNKVHVNCNCNLFSNSAYILLLKMVMLSLCFEYGNSKNDKCTWLRIHPSSMSNMLNISLLFIKEQ